MAAQDLCTLTDVKTELEATASARDTLLAALITAASDTIMRELEREFKSTAGTNNDGVAATRIFPWQGGTRIIDLAPYDLQTCTAVALSPEDANTALTVGNGASGGLVTVAAPDVLFKPLSKPDGVFTHMQISDLVMVRVSNLLFRFGFLNISVTGTWGFASVPTPVKQACVLTVASWARKDVAQFGIEDYGREGDAVMPSAAPYYALPPAACKLLNPYRRFAGVL